MATPNTVHACDDSNPVPRNTSAAITAVFQPVAKLAVVQMANVHAFGLTHWNAPACQKVRGRPPPVARAGSAVAIRQAN